MTDVDEGYFKSTSHNYVSRKSTITTPKQFDINGRSILHPGVVIRSDKQIVRIGRYCEVSNDTVIDPPPHPLIESILKDNEGETAPPTNEELMKNKKLYIPVVIGSHTTIGKDCHIRAAAIGGMVWIGDNVTIGKRCIVKDNCVIESGVTLGNDTVIPPFTRITASNPKSYQELPPRTSALLQEKTIDNFTQFAQVQRERN
mmetsp:Transcript_48539/g.117417  ORF Transcript_48539/g.117417 Transcript_48539/m.117417 type:complete len:201 (-) Transcript_48539:34-636(-)